jgi:hypothetical protein
MTGNPDKSLTIDTHHHTLQRGLTQAIVTAYLITGSTGRSEAAVMAAIEHWEPNKGVKSLLELVAGLAVKYEGGPRDEWPLRGELQNVVQLPRNARRSFVLRILLGVPREVCTKLLDLNTDEVDHQTCAALVALGTQDFETRNSTKTMNEQDTHQQRIERLAYQLWQERGSPLGSPEDDWFRAENEFRREASPALLLSEFVMGPVEE